MIRTYVGPMYSGKSDALISTYLRIWNKGLVMAFKPSKDTRDGAEIKSKNYDTAIPAIVIDDISEIKNHVIPNNIRTVFIDEAQLLTGDVSELVDLAVLFDIDFYIAGLNMTSEQKPFGIINDILSVSDEVSVINGFCQDCNKPSRYSYYYLDDKDGDVKVGDTGYVSLCPSCLGKRKLAKNPALLKKYKGEA